MPHNHVQFGLMPVLDAIAELPRTVLPLKSVRYRFVARGGLAEVELTQVYCQENAQPLDCEYLFPLPADGAVYHCEAVINGRVIRARVEEREAARKIVAEKKAEGRRTALVEAERDNLFTLSLGNVQPGDVVEVKLGYLQPLRRQGSEVSLDLPLCPGVRYIPGRGLLRSNRGSGIEDDTDQVPDASRITPPRIDGEHPDAAFVELTGRVEAGSVDGDVTSPSHRLMITREGDVLQLALAGGGEVPDRDLALRWSETRPAKAELRGWTHQMDGYDYALLELRAPEKLDAKNAVPQDVYFLVDRSGSMSGGKWRKAVAALQACVEVLKAEDRVWITLFESKCQDFGSEPVSPVELMADRKFCGLAALGTGGGTEMEPALRHVLEKVKKFSNKRPAVVVLITDAQIGNEREIVSLMREHPALPVHCFGIDTTLNDSLLLDLVRQQGGTFHALQPHEDVAGRVKKLGCMLGQPVLVDLVAPEGWELAAGAMPNLYAGQVQLISLRSKSMQACGKIELKARDHQNQAASCQFQLKPVPEAAPRLRWCKERLVNLVARQDKAAAIDLSRESNLICQYTAFMAWDEQEKVAVANHRLVQPSLKPEYARMAGFRCYARPRDLHAKMIVEDVAMLSSEVRCRPMPELEMPMLLSELRERKSREDSSARKPVPTVADLIERILDLMRAVASMTRGAELAAGLNTVLEWLEYLSDVAEMIAAAQLLDASEHDCQAWRELHDRSDEMGAQFVENRMVERLNDFLREHNLVSS